MNGKPERWSCSKSTGLYRHCGWPATVERDGKWWCTRHDPVRVAEKIRLRKELHAKQIDRRDRWDAAAEKSEEAFALAMMLAEDLHDREVFRYSYKQYGKRAKKIVEQYRKARADMERTNNEMIEHRGKKAV